MFRSLTLTGILACALLAAAIVLRLEPGSLSRTSGTYFEAHVESDQSGLVQVYADVGRGFNEADSTFQPIAAGEPATLRFPLPYGVVTQLRFDPLDRDGRVSVSGARIVDRSGHEVAAFPPSAFKPWNQIDAADIRDGKLFLVTTPHGLDPSLILPLPGGPIILRRPSVPGQFATGFLALLAGLVLLGWARGSPRVRLDDRWSSLWQRAAASPGASIALMALLATLAANYPVVFAGKSLVSPNLNVALLYGQNPWLPHQQSAEIGDPKGADVAALMWHHLPLSMIQFRAVFQDFELPLWNRYDSTGVPLLGQGQSCFGDLLQAIPVLANGAPWAWDLKFIVAKWLFALGMGLCAWRCFRHLPTALLLAASSAFIGLFVYRINHPAIFSLCYAPWILYCWLSITEARCRRSSILGLVALIGANWTEMNSGTAKEAYVLLFALNFAGLCVLLWSERETRDKVKLLGGAVLAGIIFTLISAPVWYTFSHALKAAYTSYNEPQAFQIPPALFIGLFDEAFYRPFQTLSVVKNPSANFLVLLGILWGLIRIRSLFADRRAAALAVSSIPALILVFGILPPGAINRVPFLGNILHIDNTFSCALIVILGVLSGFGLRDAWGRLGTPEGRRDAVAVLAIALVLFAAYFGTAQAVLRSDYAGITWGRVIHVAPFIYAYALSLFVGLALFLGIGSFGRSSAAGAVALLLAFGLLHWRMGLTLGSEYPDYVVRPTARMDIQQPSQAIRYIQAHRETPFRVLGFHNDLLPGWSIVYGLEGICGPDALINPYYREFMAAADVPRIWDWRYIVEASDVARLRPVLDLLGVRYYAGYHLGDQQPAKLDKVVGADMDVFESPTAWPRAFFTDSAAVYTTTAEYCSWIKAGDGRPFVALQDQDWARVEPQPRVSNDLSTREVRPATDYHLTTNSTSFTVSASGPGFIVLTEAYEPENFRAWLNGARVYYYRVNHAFRGIYVDRAGTYEVRFTYWPKGFSRALDCFYGGMALLAGAVLFAFMGPKPRADSLSASAA
jgi:hypothetical protein